MGKSMNWALDPRQPRKVVINNITKPQLANKATAAKASEE
jgi:hypothetical protein